MAPATVLAFAEPAEAVYARTVRGMRTCLNAGPSPMLLGPSSALDADWFPGLGSGEITYTVQGLPTILVRVEGDAAAARVAVTHANIPGPGARTNDAWVRHWAEGGRACPTLGQNRPPA